MLPGIRETSLDVTAQQTKVDTAISGIAAHTGINGCATLAPITSLAIGARKKRCIRYIPNDSFDKVVTMAGAFFLLMQLNIRKAPKVARTTLGVQNSQAHSSMGVSIICPGTPFNQKDHPVNAAPRRKDTIPTLIRFLSLHSR